MDIFVPVFQQEKEFEYDTGIWRVSSMEDVDSPIEFGFKTFEEAEKHIFENGYRKSKYFKDGFTDEDYEKDTKFPYEFASIFKIQLK